MIPDAARSLSTPELLSLIFERDVHLIVAELGCAPSAAIDLKLMAATLIAPLIPRVRTRPAPAVTK